MMSQERPTKVSELGNVEKALLPILRHFLTAFYAPHTMSWRIAYRTSQEIWGDSRGLAIGQAAGDLIAHCVAQRAHALEYRDALNLDERQGLTEDEMTLLDALYHMRQNNVPAARTTIEKLFDGQIPARFVEAGLKLTTLLGSDRPKTSRYKPRLKAV